MKENMNAMSCLTDVEFATNPEPRCACLVLVDISGSMNGHPIGELNAGLMTLRQTLDADPLACLRVELALVSFNNVVTTVVDFTSPATFQPPTLAASGGTSLGFGLIHSLNLLEARVTGYRAAGLPYYRPWLMCLTDAEATDDITAAARRIREAEGKKRLAFFGVGVKSADMAKLAELSLRPPLNLDGLRFADLFVWLSTSLGGVALSQPGEQVPLPVPDWATV